MNKCCELCAESHPAIKGGQWRCIEEGCKCHKESPVSDWEKNWKPFSEWFDLLSRLQDSLGAPIDPKGTEQRMLEVIDTFRAQAKAEGIEEWIRENQPISGFECSEHEHPMPYCLLCHEQDLKESKAEGYTQGRVDEAKTCEGCKKDSDKIRAEGYREGSLAAFEILHKHFMGTQSKEAMDALEAAQKEILTSNEEGI